MNSQKKSYPEKKMALLIATLEGGGAEKVWVILANELAARGFSVDLLVLKASGAFLQNVSSYVRVVELKCSRAALALPALTRYLRQENPYALISALNYINLLAYFSCKISRQHTKLIVSEHTTLSRSAIIAGKIKRLVLRPLIRHAYLSADRIVCVSAGVAADLKEFLGISDKTTVIHNPIPISEIRRLSEAPALHPWLEPNQPPVIISMGRLTADKDFETLLRAFSTLRTKINARLIVLGNGQERSALLRLSDELKISEHVVFPGYVDNPFSWIAKARVFVLSSRREGLSNALIEAMACSVPVVSTDCPSGPREILEDGRWGKLVPVGDHTALCGAICEAINQENCRDPLYRARQFDVDIAVAKYLDTLKLSRP